MDRVPDRLLNSSKGVDVMGGVPRSSQPDRDHGVALRGGHIARRQQAQRLFYGLVVNHELTPIGV